MRASCRRARHRRRHGGPLQVEHVAVAKRLKIAIVGCGWVSDWHARDGLYRLPELFEIAACCDIDAGRREAFAKRYGIARQSGALSEILAIPDIDVVAICTPPGSHYEMVREALASGKHVVCEKPLTSSLALVDSIRELEKRSRGRVMPVFQCRFGHGIAKVRHVIQAGLAGRHYVSAIETAKTRGPDYYKVLWRGKFATELGGVLLTQAIHTHDLMSWLLGPVAKVAAFKTTRVNPIEVEDCAVASLQMADGSLVSLTATLGAARQVTRMRLCFENVTFEKQAYDEESAKPGNDPWLVIPKTPEIGRAINAAMAAVPEGKPGFAGQYAQFHAALATGAAFPVTLDDARASLELVTALFHASDNGHAVSLPIDPSHPRYRGWVPDAPASAQMPAA
jgi:predicted dehydrogenase